MWAENTTRDTLTFIVFLPINREWNKQQIFKGGTFDVLCQSLPCAGVLDAVSTPGGEELDQPGRGRVRDGGLQAAAAQDHQLVLLRIQAGGGSHTPGDEPQDDRRFKPEPEHPRRPAGERHAENRLSGSPRVSTENRRREPGGHESSCSAHSYVCLQRRAAEQTDVSLWAGFPRPEDTTQWKLNHCVWEIKTLSMTVIET